MVRYIVISAMIWLATKGRIMGQFNIAEMNHRLVQVITEHQLEHQLWINFDPLVTTLTIFDYKQGINLYQINPQELVVLDQRDQHPQIASQLKDIFEHYQAMLELDSEEELDYSV